MQHVMDMQRTDQEMIGTWILCIECVVSDKIRHNTLPILNYSDFIDFEQVRSDRTLLLELDYYQIC